MTVAVPGLLLHHPGTPGPRPAPRGFPTGMTNTRKP
jgi:hypothetical protein